MLMSEPGIHYLMNEQTLKKKKKKQQQQQQQHKFQSFSMEVR